jgi:CheY-like chemotaxis protein
MTPSRLLLVLIVENNRDGAETLAVLLTHYGHSVRIAYEGQEALRLATVSPPDAVILDIGLPGNDGCALAGKLYEALERRPLLIAISGYTNMASECRSAGIDHYLIKPVEPKHLAHLLQLHAIQLNVGCE